MKKKMFLALTCLFTLGIVKSVAQTAVAALHHNGNVTLYSGGQLQEALDAAEQGDTIYLSEGSFAGRVNVDKGQVIIGSGEKTIIHDYIHVNTSSDELGYNCVLDGLNIIGDIQISGKMRGMVISQCQFNNLKASDTSPIEATIIRSYCKKTLTPLYFSNLSVVSSKINKIDYNNSNGTSSFLNCNIKNVYTNVDPIFLFTNCIINNYSSGGYTYYCLIGSNSETLNGQGCWFQTNDVLDEELNCNYVDINNCIGNDGTVVGVTGGDNPYTLTPSTPHVASHKIEVDKAGQKLNVTLTIEN